MVVKLIEARDYHYAWMTGERPKAGGLFLPPGGVESPQVLDMLRELSAQVRRHCGPASWLIVAENEVVGLCSYKRLPDAEGTVEFGYGIAESRRGRGFGTAAVAALVGKAKRDPAVSRLIALTATNNIASQRILERNGFERAGSQIDPDEGLVVVWQMHMRPCGLGQSRMRHLLFRLKGKTRRMGDKIH